MLKISRKFLIVLAVMACSFVSLYAQGGKELLVKEIAGVALSICRQNGIEVSAEALEKFTADFLMDLPERMSKRQIKTEAKLVFLNYRASLNVQQQAAEREVTARLNAKPKLDKKNLNPGESIKSPKRTNTAVSEIMPRSTAKPDESPSSSDLPPGVVSEADAFNPNVPGDYYMLERPDYSSHHNPFLYSKKIPRNTGWFSLILEQGASPKVESPFSKEYDQALKKDLKRTILKIDPYMRRDVQVLAEVTDELYNRLLLVTITDPQTEWVIMNYFKQFFRPSRKNGFLQLQFDDCNDVFSRILWPGFDTGYYIEDRDAAMDIVNWYNISFRLAREVKERNIAHNPAELAEWAEKLERDGIIAAGYYSDVINLVYQGAGLELPW